MDSISSSLLRTTTLLVRIAFSKEFEIMLINNNSVFYKKKEPLRRGDLLNAINKLAGERGAQKHHHLIRRPLAITPSYS